MSASSSSPPKRQELTEEDLRCAKQASDSLGIPAHVIVTDLAQNIVHVNSSFESFTGFTREEVLGKRSNFLQGELTDPRDVQDLKLAIQNRRETNVVILNYTKKHDAFWNTLRLRPLYGQPGSAPTALAAAASSTSSTSARPELIGYVGEIFSFPVSHMYLHDRPMLCLDDALVLMRIASSVPRSVLPVGALSGGGRDDDDEEEDLSLLSSSSSSPSPLMRVPAQQPQLLFTSSSSSTSVQRHVNYSARFAATAAATTASLPSPPPSPRLESYSFVAETLLPTRGGHFRMRAYRDNTTGAEPLAMMVGDVETQREGVLVRVHDQCQTSEVFGSLRCDCKEQLDFALDRIQHEPGGGIVLYLPQEGRGIGLANKIAAYAAQQHLGLDTVDANRHLGLPDDCREYGAVRDILNDLGITSIRLMTNNPRKITELTNLGIHVVERVPIETVPNSHFSQAYVQAKKDRMSHMFSA